MQHPGNSRSSNFALKYSAVDTKKRELFLSFYSTDNFIIITIDSKKRNIYYVEDEMAFQIIPIIKMLSKSGQIAGTLNTLFKQYQKIREEKSGSDENKKIMDVQAKINEKLESQIEIINRAMISVQSTMKSLTYICFTALVLSVLALIISIVK